MDYERSVPRWRDVPAQAPFSGTVVTCEVRDTVAIVTLNRPEQRNAITHAVLADLSRVLQSCDAAPEVRVIVITGAGRSFCVGAELAEGEFGGLAEPDAPPFEWIAPYHLRTPVIAAINGAAAGAGLTLAMQCDLRIVAEDAKLALPFVRVGVIAEWMGHWTAVQLLGLGRAAEVLLTGEVFTAAQAERWGLTNRLVPASEVLDCALGIAHQIAATTSPVAVAVSKRLLWETASSTAEEIGAREHVLLDSVLALPDALEGPTAFLQKRPPVWSATVEHDLPPWPGESAAGR